MYQTVFFSWWLFETSSFDVKTIFYLGNHGPSLPEETTGGFRRMIHGCFILLMGSDIPNTTTTWDGHKNSVNHGLYSYLPYQVVIYHINPVNNGISTTFTSTGERRISTTIHP